MSDETAEILFLYTKVRSATPLPQGIEFNAEGLVRALRLLSKVASSDNLKHCLGATSNVLKSITEECLRNGYNHALANNDSKTAQTCFNILLNKSSTCDKSVSQLDDNCTKSINRSDCPNYARDIQSCSTSTHLVVKADIHNVTTSRNRRTKSLTSDSEEGSDSDVCIETAKPRPLPSKSKEHHKKSTKNRDMEKPKSTKSRSSSDSEIQEFFEKDISDRRIKPTQTNGNKQSRAYESETVLSPSPVTRNHAKKRAIKGSRRRISSSESEACISLSPVKRKNAEKKTKKESHNRKSSSESESDLENISPKKCDKRSEPLKAKAQEKTSDNKKPAKAPRKPVKSSGSNKENEVTNRDTSKTGAPAKGNPVLPARLNNSKFMSRLKQLESSILDGTPDPFDKKNSKSPAKNEDKNKVTSKNSSNDKKTVKSSNKKTSAQTKFGKSTKKNSPPAATKSPAVESTKKSTVPKAKATAKPTARARSKKADKSGAVKNKRANNTKVSVGASNKAKDNDTQKNAKKPVAKKPNQKSKNVKAGPKEDKTKGEMTEVLSEAESKGIDITEDDSISEESCLSDIEPELRSLSSCLNSIKKKLPRQVGTATPPLKIFLQDNIQSDSEISEASSFHSVPVKLDDMNIVKRMAKANKPKESNQPQQSSINEKANDTPEALRKIIKINRKIEDRSSDIECSSFSDY